MDKKVVLVTGIGGNVGQGILRNILSSNFPIKIIGTNTIEFSAGNYFCSKVYKVPFASDKAYIKEINKIIKKENIDLIIPSTDYEVYYLAKNKGKIRCKIAVSGIKAAEIYLNKYESYLHHKKFDIPFAKAELPSNYKGQFLQCIAKPKEGRGSRGLVLNPVDVSSFKDSDYMIQELHNGIELTTAFYVTKERKLLSFITLERRLENGTTMSCEVNSEYDTEVKKIVQKIIKTTDILGSANLQFIADDRGKLYPFEINCRISGTNSIRSNFGFKDVEYTLMEHLYNAKLKKPKLLKGKAIRVLMDIIYIENNKSREKKTFNNPFIF